MSGPIVILGGAGFVGTNLADALARDGTRVRIFDNLSRPGVVANANWLREQHGDRVELIVGDIREPAAVQEALQGAQAVYHLAAQVAVTTSLAEPLLDFDVNLRGTMNVLESLRRMRVPPPLVFTSTNKVYGDLDLRFVEGPQRYVPGELRVAEQGVDEQQPLSFHSPYGCSKGAADQYVLDYARCYGLPTVVFRMSCIYGPHQMGTEDQGWVAHFCIRALRGEDITIFGDGKQVRDVLFASDLVAALRLAGDNAAALAGRAFNIGGTPANSLSLLELLALIETHVGRAPQLRFEDWRPSDQRYYTSDVRAFTGATDWRPQIAPAEGVERLLAWLAEQATPTAAPYAVAGAVRRSS